MMTMYPTIPTVLGEGAELPKYAHDGDAGMDLVATEHVTLLPGEWRMVSSRVSMAIPKEFVGLVMPRSGLGCKGLVLKSGVGVIDSTYRGEIWLTLFNNNPTHLFNNNPTNFWHRFHNMFLPHKHEGAEPEGTINVHKGDRVAQMLIVPVAFANLLQVESLDETERQDGGFGSSGLRL